MVSGAAPYELEPDAGGGVSPEPDGGAPGREPEPEPFVPMFGQLVVEPELDPEVPELDEPELEEPELEEPELEDDDGVDVDPLEVDELEVGLVPELPVEPVVEVVAAFATNAPPTRRPELSAPTASTLRRRNGMRSIPFVLCGRPTQAGTAERAPRICGSPYTRVGQCTGFPDESMTILRMGPRCSDVSRAAHRTSTARTQDATRRRTDQVSACQPANSTSASARRSHPGRGIPRASRGSASWRRGAVAGRPRSC
jgi:hypothetical protein